MKRPEEMATQYDINVFEANNYFSFGDLTPCGATFVQPTVSGRSVAICSSEVPRGVWHAAGQAVIPAIDGRCRVVAVCFGRPPFGGLGLVSRDYRHLHIALGMF